MINLLPPSHADAIRYGRQNTTLRVWLIGMLAAIAGLIVIIFGGWVYINQQEKSLQHSINLTNQQLKSQNLAQVQSDAKEITGDIRVINQVLSSEIRFSNIIQTIGQLMPQGTVLGSLSLNKVTGALDLSANAKDYSSAAQVAANLSDKDNGLFSKVDVLNVNCSSNVPNYPCSATFKALFSNQAKTKFLSVPKEGKL
jgi:Tfp pilus assembly protein PilN